MRGAMHCQRYLILGIYTLFMQSQKQGQRYSHQGAAAAARKCLSLCQILSKGSKNVKPSYLHSYFKFCPMSHRLSLHWSYRMIFRQAFFILTVCKSLKETPAWEHHRSLCCSDNWNRTQGFHANEARSAAVNRPRLLTRGYSGKAYVAHKERMWCTYHSQRR